MKNDTQTGKPLRPWPCEDPIFNHILDKSDLKSQAKKHSLLLAIVGWLFYIGFVYFYCVQENKLQLSKNKQHLLYFISSPKFLSYETSLSGLKT